MFQTKRLFIPAALISVSFLSAAAARAENPACYTVAFADQTIDANGNLSSVFVLNAPVVGDPNGARAISTGTQTGAYTVNCDGSGTVNRMLTSSLGVVTNQVDNFIITGAIVKNGKFIATMIADAVQVPSALIPGGLFITRVHYRLPDRPGPTQP